METKVGIYVLDDIFTLKATESCSEALPSHLASHLSECGNLQPSPEQDLWRKPWWEVEKHLDSDGLRPLFTDLSLTDRVEMFVNSFTGSNPPAHQKHKSFLRSKDKPELLCSISVYQPRLYSELVCRTSLLSRWMKFKLNLSIVLEWRVALKNRRIKRVLLSMQWVLQYQNGVSLMKKSSIPSRMYLCCLVTD